LAGRDGTYYDRCPGGIGEPGLDYQLLRLALPLTWGISLMRAALTEGGYLPWLIQSGELIGLSLHSMLYLLIGLSIFALGYVQARRKGTLAHY